LKQTKPIKAKFTLQSGRLRSANYCCSVSGVRLGEIDIPEGLLRYLFREEWQSLREIIQHIREIGLTRNTINELLDKLDSSAQFSKGVTACLATLKEYEQLSPKGKMHVYVGWGEWGNHRIDEYILTNGRTRCALQIRGEGESYAKQQEQIEKALNAFPFPKNVYVKRRYSRAIAIPLQTFIFLIKLDLEKVERVARLLAQLERICSHLTAKRIIQVVDSIVYRCETDLLEIAEIDAEKREVRDRLFAKLLRKPVETRHGVLITLGENNIYYVDADGNTFKISNQRNVTALKEKVARIAAGNQVRLQPEEDAEILTMVNTMLRKVQKH